MAAEVTLDGKPFSGTITMVSSVVPPPPPPTPTLGIDWNIWKVTLPTGSAEKPTEIFQPVLATYQDSNFYRNPNGSTTFKARVDGVTTSGSDYCRSELREMKPGGKDQASWSTSSGTHIMTLVQSVDHSPVVKPQVTCGQIHDSSDDLLGILFDGFNGDGVSKPARIMARIRGTSHTTPILDSYMLGQKMTITITAKDGKVTIHNGTKVTHTFSAAKSGCYFKAGCYTQSNVSKGDKPEAYGQVTIYSCKVEHS